MSSCMFLVFLSYVTLRALCKPRHSELTLDPCCYFREGAFSCGHVLRRHRTAIYGWVAEHQTPPACHVTCPQFDHMKFGAERAGRFVFTMYVLTAADYRLLWDLDGHIRLSCTDTHGEKMDWKICKRIYHKFEKELLLYNCPLMNTSCSHRKFYVQVKKVPFEPNYCLPSIFESVWLHRVTLQGRRTQQPPTERYTTVKGSATTFKGTTRVAPKITKPRKISSTTPFLYFAPVLTSTSTAKILDAKVHIAPSRPENSTKANHAAITTTNYGLHIAIAITVVILCVGAVVGTWIWRRTKEKRTQVGRVQASSWWTMPGVSSTKKRRVLVVTPQNEKNLAASTKNSFVKTFIHWSDPRTTPQGLRPQKEKIAFTKQSSGRSMSIDLPKKKRMSKHKKKTPVLSQKKINPRRKFYDQTSDHRTEPRFMSLDSGRPKHAETFVHLSDPRVFRPSPTEGFVNENKVEGRES